MIPYGSAFTVRTMVDVTGFLVTLRIGRKSPGPVLGVNLMDRTGDELQKLVPITVGAVHVMTEGSSIHSGDRESPVM